MNRRDFLKTIGAALVAAAVPVVAQKRTKGPTHPITLSSPAVSPVGIKIENVWVILGRYRGGIWVGKETKFSYCYRWSDGENYSSLQVDNNGSGLERWFKINCVVD